MSEISVNPRDLRQAADDLRDLARECVEQARVNSTDPTATRSESASLAAKNWAAAALSATQAWMTTARGPGR